MRIYSLIFFFFLFQSNAFSWGYLQTLNTEYKKSHLIFDIIQNNEIKYCLEINDSNFLYQNLLIQTEVAIKAWIIPLNHLLNKHIQIKNISCEDKYFDLKIVIGPEHQYPTLGAYTNRKN